MIGEDRDNVVLCKNCQDYSGLSVRIFFEIVSRYKFRQSCKQSGRKFSTGRVYFLLNFLYFPSIGTSAQEV